MKSLIFAILSVPVIVVTVIMAVLLIPLLLLLEKILDRVDFSGVYGANGAGPSL
jgi:hypothetical protein